MSRTRFGFLALFVILAITCILVGRMLLHAATQPNKSLTNVEDLLEWEAESLLNDPKYEQQFIRTGPPDMQYNCHGWTFARGQHAVSDDEVNLILQSGRFRQVTIPMSGDIVVYYTKEGSLCHSGIVKATGRGGFVLVESKWGGAGRFLHLINLPAVQTRHEYYRRNYPSSRSTR